MKIPYYPGCTLKTAARNFEDSAIASAKALDIELVELPRWNCCGTVFSLASDDLMHHIAPIRNLIYVQEMNDKGIVKDEYRLVTLCSMCYNTLKRANSFVRENPDKLETINAFIEENYKGKVEVHHFLDLLRDGSFEKVEERVKNPFRGLRIAPYYGCLMSRPRGVGTDDMEKPTILDKLLRALDAEAIDNPNKMKCCGSYHTVHRKDVVAELAFDILSHAISEGAEAIAVTCPLCAFNLDNRQEDIKRIHRNFSQIPVFYFTQLMVIAFGLDSKCCNFDLNHVNPRPLLKKRGLWKAQNM